MCCLRTSVLISNSIHDTPTHTSRSTENIGPSHLKVLLFCAMGKRMLYLAITGRVSNEYSFILTTEVLSFS